MAYTTFFLCQSDQLPGGFPGWKPPPVKRTVINPFTRQEMEITTDEPEWDADPSGTPMPEFAVANIQGDYATYLENRIPRFVQSQPHWCGKNLTLIELQPLVRAVLQAPDLILRSPLFAHPASNSLLLEVPLEFVSILARATDADLQDLARSWAEAMSTPSRTHSVGGQRLRDDWTHEDALRCLMPIVALSREQTGTQRLYLLWEL